MMSGSGFFNKSFYGLYWLEERIQVQWYISCDIVMGLKSPIRCFSRLAYISFSFLLCLYTHWSSEAFLNFLLFSLCVFVWRGCLV